MTKTQRMIDLITARILHEVSDIVSQTEVQEDGLEQTLASLARRLEDRAVALEQTEEEVV